MPLPLLKQQIDAALAIKSTSTDPAAAVEVRQNIANAIAVAVDAYIQEQIGLRFLQLIPGGFLVPCPTPVGPVPTPPIPGPAFGALTRIH